MQFCEGEGNLIVWVVWVGVDLHKFSICRSVSHINTGSEVVTGGTTQLHDVPILGIYQTANEGIYMYMHMYIHFASHKSTCIYCNVCV